MAHVAYRRCGFRMCVRDGTRGWAALAGVLSAQRMVVVARVPRRWLRRGARVLHRDTLGSTPGAAGFGRCDGPSLGPGMRWRCSVWLRRRLANKPLERPGMIRRCEGNRRRAGRSAFRWTDKIPLCGWWVGRDSLGQWTSRSWARCGTWRPLPSDGPSGSYGGCTDDMAGADGGSGRAPSPRRDCPSRGGSLVRGSRYRPTGDEGQVPVVGLRDEEIT